MRDHIVVVGTAPRAGPRSTRCSATTSRPRNRRRGHRPGGARARRRRAGHRARLRHPVGRAAGGRRAARGASSWPPTGTTPRCWSRSPRASSRRRRKIVAAVREAENVHCCGSPGPTRWWCPPRRPAGCSAWRRRRRASWTWWRTCSRPRPGWRSPSARSSPEEVGGSPRHLPDIVLGVVRDGRLLRVDDAGGRRDRAGRPAAVQSAARAPSDERIRRVHTAKHPLLSRGASTGPKVAFRRRRLPCRLGGGAGIAGGPPQPGPGGRRRRGPRRPAA